jgi:hypothetical protein
VTNRDELLAEIAGRRRQAIKLTDVEFYDQLTQALREPVTSQLVTVTALAALERMRSLERRETLGLVGDVSVVFVGDVSVVFVHRRR